MGAFLGASEMTNISRRAIFKAIGLAPAAVPILAQQIQLAASGAFGLRHNGPVLGGSIAEPSLGEGQTFTSFAEWWRKFGHDHTIKNTENPSSLDPDLIVMRSLPITAKIRIQRARNTEKLRAMQERNFLRDIARNGVFRWFP